MRYTTTMASCVKLSTGAAASRPFRTASSSRTCCAGCSSHLPVLLCQRVSAHRRRMSTTSNTRSFSRHHMLCNSWYPVRPPAGCSCSYSLLQGLGLGAHSCRHLSHTWAGWGGALSQATFHAETGRYWGKTLNTETLWHKLSAYMPYFCSPLVGHLTVATGGQRLSRQVVCCFTWRGSLGSLVRPPFCRWWFHRGGRIPLGSALVPPLFLSSFDGGVRVGTFILI